MRDFPHILNDKGGVVMWIDIYGVVAADTVYADNVLVAKDIEVTLPEVQPMMADVSAMGTMSVPVWQLLDNMELSITRIGVDAGLKALLKADTFAIEVRFVQNKIDANGITKQVGCKAFLKGVASKIPGVSLNVGEGSSNELTHTITRYQLFVDGEEMFLIDRLAGKVVIDGKDYMETTTSLL